MTEKRPSPSFPTPTDLGERQWGKEELLFSVPKHFTFKKITMNKGAKGGLQYHHKKDEGGYVVCRKLCLLGLIGSGGAGCNGLGSVCEGVIFSSFRKDASTKQKR